MFRFYNLSVSRMTTEHERGPGPETIDGLVGCNDNQNVIYQWNNKYSIQHTDIIHFVVHATCISSLRCSAFAFSLSAVQDLTTFGINIGRSNAPPIRIYTMCFCWYVCINIRTWYIHTYSSSRSSVVQYLYNNINSFLFYVCRQRRWGLRAVPSFVARVHLNEARSMWVRTCMCQRSWYYSCSYQYMCPTYLGLSWYCIY